MSYKKAKLEFFYIRKSFLKYGGGFKYLKNKYFLAPKILKTENILEKPAARSDLSVHILTGHDHLIMCIWSLGGFYKNIENIGTLYLHSDGSLTQEDKNLLFRFFPSIKIINPDEFLNQNGHKLNDYPIIKDFRVNRPEYFLLKKLIDPYFTTDKKYRLIIDADLAWFNQAKELDREIENGCSNSLMMENNRSCYVSFKNGENLSDEMASYNSGIVLYRRDNFDLDKLSRYLNNFDTEKPENKHFIEQAAYASCLNNLKKLPETYTIAEEIKQNTVMKHYTSVRRHLFYAEALEKLKQEFL